MTTGVRRPSIRAASIWLLLAVLLTVAFVACTQEAGTSVATAGVSKEAASTNASPSPEAPQTAGDGTATAGTGTTATAAVGAVTVTARAGKPAASPTAKAAPVDPADAGVLYAQCIRANGVPNFPDPGPDGRFRVSHGEGGIDQDDPKYRAALEKCRDLTPGGEHRNTGDAAYVEQMREFSQCMRDNGLPNFPDPDASGRLRGIGHEAQDNPKYRAANEICRDKLPGGGAHR